MPFSVVAGVTTSHVGRRQGLASRTTAMAVARGAAGGAVVAGLGMFEAGFYDRIGFGTGSYDHYLDFDPRSIRLPDGVCARPPKRFGDDAVERTHAARLRRHRGHASCSFPDFRFTQSENMYRGNSLVLGYTDNADGSISHCVCISPRRGAFAGVTRVWWMSFTTREQLLELFSVLRNLGDQVRVLQVSEPVGVMLQDIIDQPFRATVMTMTASPRYQQWMIAWWQMRICTLHGAMACTHLPWLEDEPLRFNLVLADPITRYLPDDAPWTGVAGSYTITLGAPSSAVVGIDESLPTITTSVGTFTRLWLGVRPASGLAVFGDLEAPPDVLDALDRALRLQYANPDWEF